MTYRTLHIDFNLYTHQDPDFQKELLGLMLKDILELQQSLQFSLELNDSSFYRKSCHKMNSTLILLDDQEFINVVGEVKQDINDREKTDSFFMLCYEIMKSLKANQITDNLISKETANHH